MIESLHIEDLGVIEEADLVLSPGLTALTGETGAGKTMVLTSLGLLLGQRAESTIVRAGAERALVEGVFTLDGDSPAIRRAVEAGAELEDDELIVSRTVPASGRSRAHLGGRAVPSAVLSEVGAHLVSVHGQGDQFRLRSTSAQRRALDCLGGREHAALCRRYAEAYRARQAVADGRRLGRPDGLGLPLHPAGTAPGTAPGAPPARAPVATGGGRAREQHPRGRRRSRRGPPWRSRWSWSARLPGVVRGVERCLCVSIRL